MMVNSYLKTTHKIIGEIINLVSESKKDLVSEGLVDFIKEFYKFVPPEDLEGHNIEQLAASVTTAFKFFKVRPRGTGKIRIYNPTLKEHGWENGQTVIDIINDDVPFLVDSVIEELTRHDIKIHTLAHPVIEVIRDKAGNLQSLHPLKGDSSGKDAESVMQLLISKIHNEKQLARLEAAINRVLDAVKVSVADWAAVLKKIHYVITELSASAKCFSISCSVKEKEILSENALEIKEFLEWLRNGNFVFLGYVEYSGNAAKSETPQVVKGSELGILKLGDSEIVPSGWIQESSDNPLLEKDQTLLGITKANKKSLVHRPVQMDYIGVKRINEKGEVIGEHSFIGLFTSSVYYQSAKEIPIIRKKIEAIHKKSGFSKAGHSGKALVAILEDFPRDELLQSTEAELFDAAMAITLLAIQPKVRLFMRKDEFERFISCIIFLPRERMSTELRNKMEKILTESLNGVVVNHYTQITESHLARLQIIIKTEPGQVPKYSEQKIEELLAKVTRKWSDDLQEELSNRFGEETGEKLFNSYKDAFTVSYQNRFSTEDAYYDIMQIEKVVESGQVGFDLYESLEGTEEIFEFKVYAPKEQIPLSKIMPILDNMGLTTIDEHTYQAKPASADTSIWIHRFRFSVSGMKKPKLNAIKKNFEESVTKTWLGYIESDALNKLILLANLKWRDIVIVRSYSKFLQQSGFTYSQAYIQEAVGNHASIVKLLIELFYCRFDPAFTEDRETTQVKLVANIENVLSKVSNLAEDRVIRGLLALIMATYRTNFFQKNNKGELKDYISFKLQSSSIAWLPKPRPYAEIFVYSPRIEGVHLRGGKVARGGLRWSDRREDFRTEILGLLKAQMTKNSVIIPVGSKGGFYVKQSPVSEGREAVQKEGIECYKTFLRGLLDVTDNIVNGKIKHPKDVVRHDGEDAYLVVAADKGTATFSDIANGISEEYNFWLGDAFASGGSVGYDHKKMAITARGAWISVARHFSEIGIDVSKEDFTVIGIGDMAGDVFGNGLLRSEHARLLGAFNHMHIFLDPNPDLASSFKERKRLFELPRSTWADYDAKLISKGGGVFERSAKSIKLSSEVIEILKIDATDVTPDELIRAMLKAPVDLLWNGGIGTYVKAKTEVNEAVGDKTNDNLRINGEEVGARVVGEGGNLGFTQLGRIEYARKGGRLNTDAIDNSAGVDCSDHEVNLKIALGAAIAKGKLTLPARNKLLESMTDEVAELVLNDNRLQTQAITFAQQQGNSVLEVLGRFISSLEKAGLLDRAIEFLPSDEEITKRLAEGKGLVRPELAIVLAYSKIVLYEELIKSNLPDDAYYTGNLMGYFPEPVQEQFEDEITNHPLRREIIATVVTNNIINRIGTALFYHLKEDTGIESCDIARAYTVTSDVFELESLWEEIGGLKNIKPEEQKELFLEIQHIVEMTSVWFLRNSTQPLQISKVAESFAPGVRDLYGCLTKVLSEQMKESYQTRLQRFKSFGLPVALAEKIASLEAMSSACDIVEVARKSGLTVEVAAKAYFQIGSRLSLGWLRRALHKLTPHSYWERISNNTLVDELYVEQTRLTLQFIKLLGKDNNYTKAMDTLIYANEKQVERYDRFLFDLKAKEEPDLSMIIIAIRKVREIG
ncbi:MAG: NAD-glutamate dehydrogenase [Rickettsiaceae bacterium]|jgi:glutamate dehydrogenase|nr:NAD-glutamate dehydrogenase [Rickettsiaceae bacterium]